MTVPTSWSSATLSTCSPIANFDIENSFWNHRCDYISTSWLSLLNEVPPGIWHAGCCTNVSSSSSERAVPRREREAIKPGSEWPGERHKKSRCSPRARLDRPEDTVLNLSH